MQNNPYQTPSPETPDPNPYRDYRKINQRWDMRCSIFGTALFVFGGVLALVAMDYYRTNKGPDLVQLLYFSAASACLLGTVAIFIGSKALMLIRKHDKPTDEHRDVLDVNKSNR